MMSNAEQSNRRTVSGVLCLVALAAAFPALTQGAERDICEKMTGEQLRRCIETSARAQPSVPAPAAGIRAPAAGQPVIPPPTAAGSRAATAQPGTGQKLNCTKVPQPDQALCVHRNTALIECSNRIKYADPDKCVDDIMSRAPNPSIADCSELPTAQRTACLKRNKVYASCKGEKMNYFACLETRMAKSK
jgi:hypothetical protein